MLIITKHDKSSCGSHLLENILGAKSEESGHHSEQLIQEGFGYKINLKSLCSELKTPQDRKA